MTEVQILIPVRGNDGADFPIEDHEQFEDVLNNTLGGWQKRPGIVTGGWKDKMTGIAYQDDLYMYIIAVDGLVASADKIISVVNEAKSNYQQLAIYISYFGISEVL